MGYLPLQSTQCPPVSRDWPAAMQRNYDDVQAPSVARGGRPAALRGVDGSKRRAIDLTGETSATAAAAATTAARRAPSVTRSEPGPRATRGVQSHLVFDWLRE